MSQLLRSLLTSNDLNPSSGLKFLLKLAKIVIKIEHHLNIKSEKILRLLRLIFIFGIAGFHLMKFGINAKSLQV